MENISKNKVVEQTGFLYKFDPRDFVTGSSPLVLPIINITGDWKPYQPVGEKQYKYSTFDTMSCTTFSCTNIIETWINWHKANNHFTEKQIQTLNTLGFFADGKFNCSDRFTAIMSGTMRNGNYFQSVLDSVRKDGLLPEALLAFGGNSWDEYHNKTLITKEMKDTAKKILEILDISYEWVASVDDIDNNLKQCPIQGAIPFEASHAIQIIAPGYYFDSYEPFVKPLPVVRYAMKVIVFVKPEVKPITRTLKMSMTGGDVVILQSNLKALGYSIGVVDGKFGKLTLNAVKSFQSDNGLHSDGIVGPMTHQKIIDVLKKNSKLGLLPTVQSRANMFILKCKSLGINIRIVEGFRTKERQEELYQQGRTTPGPIVTNVQYPKSLHCHGLAFDVCFEGATPYPSDNKKWKAIADIAKELGLTPGYYFSKSDRPHFEFKGKYLYKDIYDFKYNKADFL